jgi:O-antigen/teichoic acid export membrane protein
MGPSYAELSGRVLAILSLPLLLYAGTHAMGGIMIGVEKHKPMAIAMLAEAIANVALSLALLPRLGIVGVAWGTAVPSVVSSACFWPLYICRSLDIPINAYFRTVWIRPWLAVVPFAIASSAVEFWFPAKTIVVFFTQVAGCLSLAVAADWWICFDSAERATILRHVQHRLPRLTGATG